MAPEKGTLVEVVWRDACSMDHGWTSGEFAIDKTDADEMQLHRTAGYVLQWDRNVVAIAHSTSLRRHRPAWDYVMTIPPKMVVSHRVFKGAK